MNGNVELWSPVPLPEFAAAYEVSTRGRVRSVARLIVDEAGRHRRWRGRVLRLHTNGGSGLPRCTLSHNGHKITYYPRPAEPLGHNELGEQPWPTKSTNATHSAPLSQITSVPRMTWYPAPSPRDSTTYAPSQTAESPSPSPITNATNAA